MKCPIHRGEDDFPECAGCARDAFERAEAAEARVEELETAIGVATPTALRVLLELLPPEATDDRDFAQGVLDRINRAMAKRSPADSVSTLSPAQALLRAVQDARRIAYETGAVYTYAKLDHVIEHLMSVPAGHLTRAPETGSTSEGR